MLAICRLTCGDRRTSVVRTVAFIRRFLVRLAVLLRTRIDIGADINIYVGNLPFNYDSSSLEQLFSSYGAVQSASVISDRETGRSRGFGFVEMSDDDGRKAIEELNGNEIDGRRLTVNEARPRSGGGGGGGGGGRRGGGGRY